MDLDGRLKPLSVNLGWLVAASKSDYCKSVKITEKRPNKVVEDRCDKPPCESQHYCFIATQDKTYCDGCNYRTIAPVIPAIILTNS